MVSVFDHPWLSEGRTDMTFPSIFAIIGASCSVFFLIHTIVAALTARMLKNLPVHAPGTVWPLLVHSIFHINTLSSKGDEATWRRTKSSLEGRIKRGDIVGCVTMGGGRRTRDQHEGASYAIIRIVNRVKLSHPDRRHHSCNWVDYCSVLYPLSRPAVCQSCSNVSPWCPCPRLLIVQVVQFRILVCQQWTQPIRLHLNCYLNHSHCLGSCRSGTQPLIVLRF